MPPQYKLLRFDDPRALAQTAVQRWLGPSAPAFRHVALSGGRIAGEFLKAAARLPTGAGAKLRQTHFFWADERCVPPESQESNYGLAKKALLDPAEIDPVFVHRIKGEIHPTKALEEANAAIQQVLPHNAAGLPVLDLAILGMGEDGHIASLFPGDTTRNKNVGTAYALVTGPKPPNPRITTSFEVLAAARQAWVLVSGQGKEEALRNSLMGNALTPLAELIELRAETLIFTDRIILNDVGARTVEPSDK